MQGENAVELFGLLLREGGGFVLAADDGRRLSLLLHRVPVDAVEKRVCVIGVPDGDGGIEVEGVRLA